MNTCVTHIRRCSHRRGFWESFTEHGHPNPLQLTLSIESRLHFSRKLRSMTNTFVARSKTYMNLAKPQRRVDTYSSQGKNTADGSCDIKQTDHLIGRTCSRMHGGCRSWSSDKQRRPLRALLYSTGIHIISLSYLGIGTLNRCSLTNLEFSRELARCSCYTLLRGGWIRNAK